MRYVAVVTLSIFIVLASRAPRTPAAQTGADKPAPKSAQARTAKQKFDAAMARADEAWRVVASAAHRQLVKDLEAALKTAGTSGNTEEVALIAEAVREAKQELARLDKKKRPSKVRSGRVYAAKGWQPALKVKRGQVLQITAGGKWAVSARPEHRSGPGGIDQTHDGIAFGMLMGRVGEETFTLGTEAEIEVPADGVLELACHDEDGGRDNNSGYVDVKISID